MQIYTDNIIIHEFENPDNLRSSLAQTPGPDLACQDAVMESETFVSSEDSWISTCRRARAGWHAKHEYKELTCEIV